MKYLILPLIIIALLCFSCEDEPTNPSNENVILPLDINNTWTYDLYYYNSSNPDSLYDQNTMIKTVDSIIDINDNDWYLINERIDYYGLMYFVRNKNDGLWTHIINDPNNQILKLKYPTAIGDTFYIGHCTTIDIDIQIKTAIGEFQCIKYKLFNEEKPTKVQYEYYCPNIGMIKHEYLTIIDQDTVYKVLELRDYILN